MSSESGDETWRFSMPGGLPDDIYWHDDDYTAVEVELEGPMPAELEDTWKRGEQPNSSDAPGASTSTKTSRVPTDSKRKGWFRSRHETPKAEPSKVESSKGAAPVVGSKNNQDSASPDELVIAVFGMTGTGKSSFIQKLTGGDVGIGHGLRSYTSEIEEVRFQIGGLNVKLIDTPGFSDTTRSDAEILTMIASWMKDAYSENTKLTGVIYLHRILDVHMSGPSLKNLRILRSLCGSENLDHVILASTMWDKVAEEEGEAREQELISDSTFWGKLKDDGARVRRFDYSQGGAMVLINELLQLSPVLLQIQKEVAIEKKTLIQTDAGRSINEEIIKLTKQYEEELAEVKQELEVTKKESDLKAQAELKAEQDRLNKKLQQAEADVKALKAPVNRKSWLMQSWKCIKCKSRLKKEKDEHFEDATGACPRCKYVQKFV